MTNPPPDRADLLRAPHFSRNLPPLPEPMVRRDNIIEAISQVTSTEAPIVFVEGEEGAGVSTLLAQFAESYEGNVFSLFIRPASRMAYSPDYLRLVLAEQYWWQLKGTRLDKQFVGEADFSSLQFRIRRYARQRPIYITVDGLHQIPTDDPTGVRAILTEVLPIGVDGFRFVIAGPQSDLEKHLASVKSKSYRLARFTDPESESLLTDLQLSQEQRKQLLLLCRGNPGRLSSTRRLMLGGVTAESILRSSPDKYLKFIRLEFQPISSLTEPQKLLLAILAFSRHSISLQEQLAIVPGSTASDLEILEKKFPFIAKNEDAPDALTFISEAHRKFAETELHHLKQRAVGLTIEHLIRNPNSANAVRLLPTYYQAVNQLDQIVELISKDHYKQLLDSTQSVTSLRARAALGARSALELQQAAKVVQFALQRSIFSAVASPEQLQSEVGALVALGNPKRAIDIAAKAPTKERRFALLAEYSRQSRERGLQVDSQIATYLRELADEIDFGELGEQAIPLAENVLFVDPDLALKIVDIALRAETSASRRDQAFTKLSMAATFSRDPDKTDIDGKANARIGNERLQRVVQSIRTIVADFSFDEIVRMVEGMDIGRQIYLLTLIVAENASRANVLDVVEHTLDLLIRNTSYTPKARDLSNLAKPLATATNDEKRVRELIGRIEAQIGLLESSASKRDLISLQMNLAHAELKLDVSLARSRVEQTYYDVAGHQNVEIQALCLAEMFSSLQKMDTSGDLEEKDGVRTVVLSDLTNAVSCLLADTASHFQIASPAITALASSEPAKAMALAKQLNTEDRRSQAYRRIAETLVLGSWSAENATFVQKCISGIPSLTFADDSIVGVIEYCRRSDYCAEWLPELEKLVMRLRSPNATCIAEIALVGICSKLSLVAKIGPRIERFEEKVAQLDSLYERVDRCFAMSALAAAHVPERAAAIYDKACSERTAATIQNETGSVVLQNCLFLLLRAFRPLIRSKALPDGYLDRFARICQQLPCSITQATIFSELACKAWCEDQVDLCRKIVTDWCRPFLQLCNPEKPTLSSDLHSILFPALYCAHPPSALALFGQTQPADHASMVFNTALMILRRRSPAEPWDSLDDEVAKVSHEALLDILGLLSYAPTDACFYSVTEQMVKSAIHKANRNRVSSQQRTDIYNKLVALIGEKLPDSRNICHEGYKVIATAQALRLTDAREAQWDALIDMARGISNVADRSYVLLEIAESLPTKSTTLQKALLNEARELARSIPAATDRYSRIEAYIRIARKLDPPGARSAFREAMALTFEVSRPDQSAQHRRSLVDIAETFGDSALDDLAEMIDDDPARAEAKADIKRSVEVQKLKKKLSTFEGSVSRDMLSRSSLPSAAWKNLRALQCDRLVAQKPDRLSMFVDTAGTFSIEEAYPVLAWYVENAARRSEDVHAFMIPLAEVLLASTEIAFATISSVPGSSYQIGFEEAHEAGDDAEVIIHPGDRNAALEYLARWIRDYGSGTVVYCDPYFSQCDVEFLRLVLANAPSAHVRVLTTKKAVTNNGAAFDVESFLNEWNDLVIQDPPETEVIAVSLSDRATGPIHDRWLYSDQSGLKLGTSFNSIGNDKLSGISPLSAGELAEIRSELSKYLSRQRIVSGEKVTYQAISF